MDQGGLRSDVCGLQQRSFERRGANPSLLFVTESSHHRRGWMSIVHLVTNVGAHVSDRRLVSRYSVSQYLFVSACSCD